MISARQAVVAAISIAAARAPVRAQQPGQTSPRRGLPVTATIGALFEEYNRAGDENLMRLPVPFVLGIGAPGAPRRTQLEIEPAAGWHHAGATTDASGWSWTRLRFFHFLGAGRRFSHGPDVEVLVETESRPALGYGYTRIMPAWTFAYRIRGPLRATVRARYEFSVGEDPGVTDVSRVVTRSTLFLPPAEPFAFWVRNDAAVDLHGGPGQYNVEAHASLRTGPDRRLLVFAQHRTYVGSASRTLNHWRLRTGVVWTIGDIANHQPQPETR